MAKRVEQKLGLKEEVRPFQAQDIPFFSPKNQAILTVKMVFPGAGVLTEEEVQKISKKRCFDPSELAKEQSLKPGEEG